MHEFPSRRGDALVGVLNRFKNYARWSWEWFNLKPYRNSALAVFLLWLCWLAIRSPDPRDTFERRFTLAAFDFLYPKEEYALPAAIGSERNFYKVEYGSVDYTYWFRETRYDDWQAVVDLEFNLSINGPVATNLEAPLVNKTTKNTQKQKIKMQLIYQHSSWDKKWHWKSLKIDDGVDFSILPKDFVDSKILEPLKNY